MLKRSFFITALFVSFFSVKVNAQNFISVSFANGFVGNNTANNQSTASYYTSSLGWTNIQFAQSTSSNIFVAQGNDIIGMVLITDANGVKHTINGFIKWRAPSGSVTTMVFSPSESKTLATNGANGSASYTVSSTKYIGLTFNGSTLTIPGGTGGSGGSVSGNAATSGLLQALNDYLGLQPKINVSATSKSVTENTSTVSLTVTLSTAFTSSVSFKYATKDGTALDGSDYTAATGTVTFAPGEVSKTITFTVLDDATSETIEDFEIILSDPTNAAIISGLTHISIIDNDNTNPSIGASGNFIDFSACASTPSIAQEFSVLGSNLSSGIVVTPPNGFEVSTSASGPYAATLTLGTRTATTTAGSMGYCFIDVQTQDIMIDLREFSGSGVSPDQVTQLNLLDIYSGAVTYTSNDGSWAHYSVSYDLLTAITNSSYYATHVTTFGPGNRLFYIDVEFDFSTVNATSVSPTTVYVRLSGAPIGNFSGNITLASTGATGQNLAVNAVNNNALRFEGTNDYVSLGDALESLGAVTQEAWVYWKGSSIPFSEIFTKDLISAFAITNTDKLHINFGNGSVWGSGVNSTTSIPLNTWTHVAATRTATGEVKLYINGELDASTATINLTGTNTRNRLIGAKDIGVGASNYEGYFSGDIDELRMWNSALSQSDIQNRMNTALTGTESGLVAYYNFDQGVVEGANAAETTLLATYGSLNGTLSNFTLTNNLSNWVQGFFPLITGGNTVAASATLQLSHAISGGTWLSSDPTKATVDANGLVSGVAAGTTTISYTACSGTTSYSINVSASDTTPPVITGPNGTSGTTTGSTASKSIPENTVNVYTFTADESVTWSITSGPDQAKFTIDPNTGLLRFVSPPDYETPTDVGADNVYVVVLTATDAAGNTTTQTVSVTVTFVCGGAIYGTGYLSGGTGRDSNWKIVALPQGFTPSEALPYNSYVVPGGTLPGIFVNRNGYTDANGDTFYWVAPKSDASSLIGGNYNWIIEQSFTVPRTGFYDLNFSGAGDNEIGFYINGSIDTTDPIKPIITGGTQIGATWNSFTASTTFSGKAYLTAGVNKAYMVMRDYGGLTTAIISGGSFSCTPLLNGPGAGLTSTKTVSENTTDVFTFSSDESVTWSISGGEDAVQFSIDANGKLVFVNAPDFENPADGSTTGSNTYIVVVKALSTLTGLYTEQTVTVYVTDVDETAPIITGPNGSGGTTTGANSALTVPENTVPVYTFTANESVTWSLSGGADQARFSINPATGLVSFNPGPDFENPSDADANNTYIVTIKATDAAGNFSTQTLTVTVTDLVENLAPTNITLSKANLYEANTIGALVGNLTATDPDVGDTHTFALVSGNGSSGNSSFTIVGNQLKANVIFNHYTQNSYSIRIRTTDAGGLWYEKVFTISISETPSILGTGYQVGVGPTPASANPVISKGYYSNLSVSGANIASYSWTPILTLNTPTSATPQATPPQTQTYTVTVTNSFGSSTTLTITVTVLEDYNITPRNAITPNGDGKNDTWIIENITSYPNNEVRIFDRAGRSLFVERNYQNGWDGTVNGVPLKEDTYYFVITFGPGINPKKGFITIVR